MTPELATVALAFLSRVDLKGSEAPALMQVVEALKAIVQPPSGAEPLPMGQSEGTQ